MPVSAPTPDQLKQIASDMGLSLAESDVASFIALMKPSVDAYNVVDELPDDLPAVKYPRAVGYRPSLQEYAPRVHPYTQMLEGGVRGLKIAVVKEGFDLYVISLMDFHRGWRRRADALSETAKLFTLFGTYIHERHGSRYYGKAMNMTRQLIAAYDAVLAQHDLLLMPTTPMKAQPLPQPGATREEIILRAVEPIANTAPFDISHHPAMAIPCEMSDGLPISMMLVGKHFDEPTIYRAAYSFEQAGNWKQM